MRTDTPRPVLLEEYRPPAYLIDTVHLDVKLDATRTRIASKLKVRANPAAGKKKQPLVLDGEQLELESVTLNGKPADFEKADATLTIAAPPSEPFTLEIVTYCNPQANTALSGLYLSRGIFCTQCEAQGFRRITYFLDRPDVLSTYTVKLEADTDAAPVLLANGNMVERGMVESGRRRYAVWKDPHPKPSYLFAMVGGNLMSTASTFKTMSGRKVDLTIYVEPGKEDRCAWAMDCLKRSMTWDEEKFGREYDLDVFNIVAVSDFNMGAMENKGLNVFNDKLVLATPETATDRNFADIERVIAHEYFHNWTGNRITCRDWFQLCLKEGLTVYRDQEFSGDFHSHAVQRIRDVRTLKLAQFPEDQGPLAHPVRPERYIEINNFYTTTVYNKGAELCRMISTLLGPKLFRKGMDHYFFAFDGTAATVEDFIGCFEKVSGRDLKQFMLWYSQAGTPQVTVETAYDAKKFTYELTLSQEQQPTSDQQTKKPLHIPLIVGLVGPDGADIPLETRDGSIAGGLLELTKKTTTWKFQNVPARPVLSFNRHFSAPLMVAEKSKDADLAFLLAHDNDPFNRWQAAQTYAERILIAATKAIRKDKPVATPVWFIDGLRAAILDDTLEPAFRAQLLYLPPEAEIARLMQKNVDPAAIHKAVKGLAKTLATHLEADLEALYKKLEIKAEYSPLVEQAGQRAFRNAVLALLSQKGGDAATERLVKHMKKANNATDEITGLGLLSNVKGEAREAAFDRYYKRWKGDHLMIDHWFGFQATAEPASTISVVKKLMKHELFAMTNPNKVRALIFPFAGANPSNFHREDGQGYVFIADTILALDKINPQVAARLASTFRAWRTLEPGRRKLVKAELTRVLKTKGLSRDVYEIVSKTKG